MPHRPPRKPRPEPSYDYFPERRPQRAPAIPSRAPLELPDFSTLAPITPPPGFEDDARALGVEFDTGDLEKLGRYLAMLLAANDLLNLTAITDPADAWRKHILDSLTLVQALVEIPDGGKVIDVGTGGGLPGIPLAICLPQLSFTLLEATGKKIAFLRAVASALKLPNVTVVEGRAETAGHDRGYRNATGRVGGHRETYNAAVARAVGRLHTLAELTIPFVRIHGRALLIKGQQAVEELAEAQRAFHLLKCVHEGTLETPTGKIVVLTKQSGTPKDYPRRDGEPKRAPLGAARDEKSEPGDDSDPAARPRPRRTEGTRPQRQETSPPATAPAATPTSPKPRPPRPAGPAGAGSASRPAARPTGRPTGRPSASRSGPRNGPRSSDPRASSGFDSRSGGGRSRGPSSGPSDRPSGGRPGGRPGGRSGGGSSGGFGGGSGGRPTGRPGGRPTGRPSGGRPSGGRPSGGRPGGRPSRGRG